MSFETKKIPNETLSEYLTAIRVQLKFSLKDVSEKTGIKLKFLESLEKADFKTLPPDAYVLGFLGQLAGIYGVSGEELAQQYKKEKDIHGHILRGHGRLTSGGLPEFFKRIIITPKSFTLIVGLVFVAVSVIYIIWQVWSINKVPLLQILQPANNTAVAGGAVEIVGLTDPGVSLTINAQPVFVDSKGNFKTQLGLSVGPKDIVFLAKNRFGKSASKTVTVIGYDDSRKPDNKLELKVDFTSAVTLGFTVDDQAGQFLDFQSGDSKILTAKQKILLSTTDAGATFVTINGQNWGAMGRPKEQLHDVPFSPQSSGK